VPQVTGRTREALAAARLDTAAAVICVPDDDLRSMETALLVRRVRPDVRLVVRMGNSAVGRALAEAAGKDSVLDVAALAAPAVVEACRGARPRRMVLAGQTFLAADLIVDRPATLRELYGELAPIAVSRDGTATIVSPGRDTAVLPGDRVTAVGTPAEFAARHVADIPPEPATRIRHAAGARSAGAARAVELEEYGRPPGMRALGQPRPPPEQIPGIRAPGACRAQARQPRRGQQPVPIVQCAEGGELGHDVRDELAGHPRGRAPGRGDGRGGGREREVGHGPGR
jgi:Trk K+ transport system NAD-binding subunit